MTKCDECPHKVTKVLSNQYGHVQTVNVCRNECGKHAANRGHPLAPCKDCDTEYDENGFVTDWPFGEYHYCEINEDCIREGNRCPEYCNWLGAMGAHSYRPALKGEPTCGKCRHASSKDDKLHCLSHGIINISESGTCDWVRPKEDQ